MPQEIQWTFSGHTVLMRAWRALGDRGVACAIRAAAAAASPCGWALAVAVDDVERATGVLAELGLVAAPVASPVHAAADCPSVHGRLAGPGRPCASPGNHHPAEAPAPPVSG